MAMICSSLKRLLRTTSSSLALSGPSYMEKSHFRWTNFWGAGHAPSKLRLGGLVDVAISLEVPRKYLISFSSQTRSEHHQSKLRLGGPVECRDPSTLPPKSDLRPFHHKRPVSTITDLQPPVGDNGDRPVAGPRCARPQDVPRSCPSPTSRRSLTTRS
jgi:hypothetical protein